MSLTDFDLTHIFAEERLGFLSTIKKDAGTIQQNAVSWIYACKPNVLRVAVSTKSEIVSNVEFNEHVTFSFFFHKSIAAFRSQAKIVTKKMPGVPFPLTIIELQADELHDIMFFGAEISQEPVYQKTYNIDAAKKLDKQVYDSIALDYAE